GGVLHGLDDCAAAARRVRAGEAPAARTEAAVQAARGDARAAEGRVREIGAERGGPGAGASRRGPRGDTGAAPLTSPCPAARRRAQAARAAGAHTETRSSVSRGGAANAENRGASPPREPSIPSGGRPGG